MLEGKRSTYFVTGGSGFIGRNLLRELVARDQAVKALARSQRSSDLVRRLGAEPVPGDMDDVDALRQGMLGCRYLVHAAADTHHGYVTAAEERAAVRGAENVYAAAQHAGVRRAVHLSTEAVLLDGSPLHDADESTPMPDALPGGYSRSKAAAERIALAHSNDDLEVVVVRPRFVWGRDDTTALPQLIEAARSGKLAWIDGGRYPTSTTHVVNAVHGILLAMQTGRPKEVYFVTDGEAAEFREFVERLLQTQGVRAPTREVPRWLVSAAVGVGELLSWASGGRLRGPMTRQEYATLGVQVTLNIDKARNELGYAPIVSRDEGLADLARRFAPRTASVDARFAPRRRTADAVGVIAVACDEFIVF